MTKKTVQRSLRFPSDLERRIEKAAKENDRNFTNQVIYMLRRVRSYENRPATRNRPT